MRNWIKPFVAAQFKPSKPSKTFQTLQTPSPAGTPGPRPLPEQAPQGQGHSNGFLWAFKAAVCQPANPPKPSKPSKHRPQQAPQGQGHFPNRHPRAKATAMAFYGLSKLPFASPQTLQTLQNPPKPPNPPKPSKPSKHPPKPSKPSKHLPQQAPQGQGHFPNRHPRAKATAMAFYGLSKLPFASPQTLQNPPNTVPSRHPRAKATSRTGTPGPRPQQWLSMGFQSCRLPARKRSKPSKTLQTLQTPSKTVQTLQTPSKTVQTLQTPSPAGTPGPRPFPNRHPRAKATAMAFYVLSKLPFARPQTLDPFQNLPTPPNPPKPSKPSKHRPQQAPQGQGHFPNRHPRAKATAMAFYGLSKLPFASPQTLQNPPNPPNTVPNRHPRAKATSRTGTPGPRPQQWLSMGFQSCRLPARKRSKPSKTLQSLQTLQNPPNPPNTLQNRPNPPNTFPSRHPRAKATSPTGTPGPRPQQWLSMGFQSCRLPARKRSKPFKTFQTLQTLQNLPNPPNTVPSRHPRAKATSRTGTPGPRPQQWLSMGFQSCPSKPSKHRPQQAPQGQGHFPNRHPRAKATAMAFYGLSKLPFASPQTLQTLQNPPNPPNTVPSRRPLPEQAPPGPRPQQCGFLWAFTAAVCQPANPPKPSKPSKHRPQQAPQGQDHFPNRHPRAKATAMAFYELSKLPFASPQTLQNPPNTVPSRHPRAKATSRTGTPGPRPQQWLSMGFQSCRLPARKRSKPSKTLQSLQTLQNPPNPPNTLQNRPNPPNTFPSRHPRAKAIPQQAPQGQGHSNGFLWAFKAAVCPPANAPNLFKTFQTLQTLQNLPNPPNTVPSRHPRAKATSRTGTPGPRPQQWLSMGFQSCRLPARKPSKTLQTPSPAGTPGPRPLPEQVPQGQGHSNGFLWAFKAAVCQPANAPNPPKPSKASKPSKTLQTLQTPSKTVQTLQTPSPAGTPGPRPLPQQTPLGQGHSNGFLWAFKAAVCPPANAPNLPKPSKPSKPSKTFQTLQTPSPAGTPGPRPLPEQAPQGQGHSNGFLWAFKAAVYQPANPPKPSKHRPQQAPQGQGHFPNRHPKTKATAMAFYGLSKLPFASPQTLQTLQNPPNPPNTVPSRHPRAKATSRTGTPGPRPQQCGFLWAFKAAVCQPANPPKPSKPSKHRPQQAPQGHFPNRHPRAKATAMAFYGLSKLPFASPQTLQTLQNPPKPPNPPKPSKPSKHPPKPSKPSKHLPQQAPQGQGHFPNRHPRAKATAMAFYGLSKLPFARPQTLQTFQNLPNPPNPPNPPKPSKPSKHRPQQAPQGQGHFPNRHPRAKATAMWLSMGFQSCRLPARKPSKPSKTLQTPSPAHTPGPRPLPEQAPQGQGHSNGFLWAFKAAVCQPANAPNPPKPSKQTPSPAGTPGPRPLPEQAPQGQGHSNGFLWAFKAAVCPPANAPNLFQTPSPKPSKPSKPSKTFQTLQTPSPAGTPGPRPLPEQAPQGQGHSNGFLWAFKAAVCQPANAPKPSKPSKHRPQQAPQGQGHFPNRHPRAKATAMAFYGLSKLPFASPQTLQTLQNPPKPPNPPKPSKPSKHPPKPSKPSKHLPQQAPQGQGHFPNRHPRPRPQQWLSIGFQRCRLPARKRSKPSKTFQTLQTLQNLPNPPNTVPSRHPRAKATSRTGTPGPRPQQCGFLWAFKAAVCQPANSPKPSKPSKHRPQQAPQGQGHFPNRHPRAKATAMAFYGLSKLPFARPQTLQSLQTLQNPPNPPNTLQNRPNPPNTFPSRHPRAKATSPTGTPGPRPQQWLSMHFQSCRFIYPSIYPSIHPSIHLSILLPIYLSNYPSVCLSISLSIHMSTCLSVYLSIHPSIHPPIHLSIYPSLSLSLSLSVSLSLSPQCPPNRGGSAAPGR